MMPRGRALTDEQRQAMIDLLADGNSVAGVARRLEIGQSTIYQYAIGERDHLLTHKQKRKLVAARAKFYYWHELGHGRYDLESWGA